MDFEFKYDKYLENWENEKQGRREENFAENSRNVFSSTFSMHISQNPLYPEIDNRMFDTVHVNCQKHICFLPSSS